MKNQFSEWTQTWKPNKQQIIGFVFILVVFVFIAVLFWNRQLRRKVESNTVDLRTSEEKYRNLYKTAMVGLYRTTVDGNRVLSANPTLATLFGYTTVEHFIDEFSSKNGCIIEEISSTHFTDDSYYVDVDINKSLHRKTVVTFFQQT